MDVISNLKRQESYSEYLTSNKTRIEIDTLRDIDRNVIIKNLVKFKVIFTVDNFDCYTIYFNRVPYHVPKKYNITINNITEDTFNKVHNILFNICTVNSLDFYGR